MSIYQTTEDRAHERGVQSQQGTVDQLRAELAAAREENERLKRILEKQGVKLLDTLMDNERIRQEVNAAHNKAIDAAAEVAVKVASDYHGTPDETPIDSFTVWKISSAILRLKEE